MDYRYRIDYNSIGGDSLRKTSAKIITISDLLQWHNRDEIMFSSEYEKNHTWNRDEKSFLLDTIVRGFPMPPIFFRQIFDVNARKTYREIVDGCQRVRAILDYAVTEDFAIKGTHNREFGGMKFSDLAPETQESILEYEILAEVVVDNDESIIHEMFARLESVPGRKKTSAPVPQMA